VRNDGCIVIHTEALTDEEAMEVAQAIAEFMTERFPHYIRRIKGDC